MIMRQDEIAEEPDYGCPFYRFYWVSTVNVFMEKLTSNTCGLKVVTMRANSPCEMENEQMGPYWALCGLNNEENRSVLEVEISNSGVCLAGGRSLPFLDWYKEVTGGDFGI